MVAIADAGTGTHVLAELYARMKETPEEVDLTALWRELGVLSANGKVSFDETAPLAAIRRAITAPR